VHGALASAREEVEEAVLAAEFGGSRINAQNLSNWRRGGYQHWLKQQERRILAAN